MDAKGQAQVVVITGASMGIGRSLAHAWASRGATVVLSARGREALDEVAAEVRSRGGRAIALAGDVTDASYRAELISRAVSDAGGVDVLVNNAGRGYLGHASSLDLDRVRELFELNFMAPLHLVQLAMPHLERSRGAIVMVSSVAGVVAAPKYAAYSSTKFALEALSMALRAEAAQKGVRVTVVRPGPVATPFRANAVKAPGQHGYDRPDPRSQSPEDVAARTLRGVERGSAIVETSNYVRWVGAASRILPSAVRMALRRMV